jgi:hypothetical protein
VVGFELAEVFAATGDRPDSLSAAFAVEAFVGMASLRIGSPMPPLDW